MDNIRYENGNLFDKLNNSLRCVKTLSNFKIYVEPFMSIKKYYSLNIQTNEVKEEGVDNLRYIIERLNDEK